MDNHPLMDLLVNPWTLAAKVFWINTACFAAWYFLPGAIIWFRHFRQGLSQPSRRKVFVDALKPGQLRRELIYSVLTLLIIGTGWLSAWYLYWIGANQIYESVDAMPLAWIPVSAVITLVLFDAWFYWTHLAMHHPKLFRFFHVTHHQSRITTPFTGYALDPAEAATYAVFLPLVTMVLPLHPLAVSIFMALNIATNLVIHSGHEIFPAKFAHSRWGWLFSSATSHAMHHRLARGNYGFCFQYWDRLMGTCSPGYDDLLKQTTARRHWLPGGHTP
ncbi:MAG: sterol desaturase family protein [Burkholderiaceae bacterium]